MTSNHHAPYDLGHTRATMDGTVGSEAARWSETHKTVKTVISLTVSQCYLPQLAFKTSSLVIYCVFSSNLCMMIFKDRFLLSGHLFSFYLLCLFFKFVYDDFQRSISALRTIPENLTELLLTSLHLLRFLLRKEVIHPHVAVGIPCYDLTPVIGPAFDGSLPSGLRHRLRALPTPMV